MAKTTIIEMNQDSLNWRVYITPKTVRVERQINGTWTVYFKLELNKRDQWNGKRPYVLNYCKDGNWYRGFYASYRSAQVVIDKYGGPMLPASTFDLLESQLLAKEMIKGIS